MTATPAADAPAGPPFDPAAGVFIAQHRRPPQLADVDLAALSPFQRGLLVTDGTVTQFVAAYWLEPVVVTRLGQAEERLERADPWLDAPAGAPVIRRRVLLRGGTSGRLFAWADSLLALDRLPDALRRGVDQQGGGLGRILVDAALETRREGLWFGRESPADAPAAVAALWPGAFLSRSYRVVAGGSPLMVITERFPL